MELRAGVKVTASKVLVLAMVAATALGMFACKRGPADRPGAFTFHGKPIDPLAVGELYRSKDRTIDLSSFKKRGVISEWENEPGWMIAYYGENYSTGRKPFFAYLAISSPDPASSDPANSTDIYLVSIKFSDGTSGDVDNLMLVEKQGPRLSIHRTWEEGTACGGGITGQRLEGDNFFYSRDLNPRMLVRLASRTPLGLSPDDDELEAGDGDCAAAANYVYNLVEDREYLASVTLNDEPRQGPPAGAGSGTAPRFQACFDRLFNACLREGRTLLSRESLEAFVLAFKEACLDGRADPDSPIQLPATLKVP